MHGESIVKGRIEMKGTILGLPTDSQKGVISTESGERFKFDVGDIRSETELKAGDGVDFDASEGEAKDIFADLGKVKPYVAPSSQETPRSSVRRVYNRKTPISELWFSFKGRSTRYDYWVRTFLPLVGMAFVAAIIDLAMGAGEEGGFFTALVLLFGMWITLVVSAKRMKDMNYSPWLLLLWLVPIANIVIGVMIAFIPGTVGDNKFGPDPMDQVAV